jgi:hypothetical protein
MYGIRPQHQELDAEVTHGYDVLSCFCMLALMTAMLCCAVNHVQVVLKDFQHAAKAQRASVTPAEIQRYEDYNARHGAQYVQGTADGAGDGDEDDDDW